MTIAERAIADLMAKGMSRGQSLEVIKLMIQDENVTTIPWGNPVEIYSPMLIGLIDSSIKSSALEWINEFKPQAWFKPMFEGAQ
tara:strand:+ start:98 stop:349 length:252 start_codon:yes stop_codon:yes gene_type:complete